MTREDKLIKEWEKGDTRALDKLIELFYPEILRYCLWHAPNTSLAEDATQETFLKAIRYFNSYVHRGKWKAFLYQVAANTCIDMGRKKWLTDVSLDETGSKDTYSEDHFDRVQSDENFRKIIDGLPKEIRQIVILRYSQDLTMREIALVVDLPLRTVQSRLRSALKQLKKELKEGGMR